jgi:hypothetical protein
MNTLEYIKQRINTLTIIPSDYIQHVFDVVSHVKYNDKSAEELQEALDHLKSITDFTEENYFSTFDLRKYRGTLLIMDSYQEPMSGLIRQALSLLPDRETIMRRRLPKDLDELALLCSTLMCLPQDINLIRIIVTEYTNPAANVFGYGVRLLREFIQNIEEQKGDLYTKAMEVQRRTREQIVSKLQDIKNIDWQEQDRLIDAIITHENSELCKKFLRTYAQEFLRFNS